jgi:hypothetical protein
MSTGQKFGVVVGFVVLLIAGIDTGQRVYRLEQQVLFLQKQADVLCHHPELSCEEVFGVRY